MDWWHAKDKYIHNILEILDKRSSDSYEKSEQKFTAQNSDYEQTTYEPLQKNEEIHSGRFDEKTFPNKTMHSDILKMHESFENNTVSTISSKKSANRKEIEEKGSSYPKTLPVSGGSIKKTVTSTNTKGSIANTEDISEKKQSSRKVTPQLDAIKHETTSNETVGNKIDNM